MVTTNVANGETAATVTTTVFGKVTGVASDANNVYIGLGDAVTAQLGDIVTMRDDSYFDKDVTPPDNNEDNEDGDAGNNGDAGSGDGETEETPPAES